MKRVVIIGIGPFGVNEGIQRALKNLDDNGILIIDTKTASKHGKTNIVPNDYREQLLAYKELEPLLEDIPKLNPNKKPFREGSKFVPLKKKR